MRSGTRSQCKRRWTRKAHRPCCRLKLGYEFCYLYAALCPFTGHLTCLILPDMTKASFCLFSRHFREVVNQHNGKAPVLLIADGAGAHRKEVCLSSGITLEHLPRACPELNPVERLFEELRKEMSRVRSITPSKRPKPTYVGYWNLTSKTKRKSSNYANTPISVLD